MLLVAFALSSVMFVACNKYDDDIERIDNEIASLQATVQSLKAAVDGGAVISSVSNTAEGVKFTLSNGQSYVVNHGTAGADGAAGKDGSVVTIGENGNWFIDGEDTGKTAKGQGEPGKSPRINEAGNWEVWNPETEAWDDTKVSAAGAQTYVVDCGSYYELNVMEQDAEGNNIGFKAINLPKTSAITEVKVVTLDGNVIEKAGASVTLNYGLTLGSSSITFNDVKYPAYSTLIAAGSSLTAMINPVDADATVYNFALVDSKGNAPYVVNKVAANKTEGALTKAATANKGVWDMGVAFASGVSFNSDKVIARNNAVYALTTTTHQGKVASLYDVDVTEKYISSLSVGDLSKLTQKVTKSINLRDAFKGTGIVTVNTNTAEDDLNPYIVDCYFKIADQTIAEEYGLKLDGNTLTAEKATTGTTVKIKAYYLLVTGDRAAGTSSYPADEFEVEFTYVAPGAELSDVTWTINNSSSSSNHRVNVSLSSIKSQLVGAKDSDIPVMEVVGYKWADGDEFDEDYVYINGVYYSNAAGYTPITPNNMIVKSVQLLKSNGDPVSSIQNDMIARFNFDYTKAMPGEYIVTLGFKKQYNGSVESNYALVVPVKVTIVAPEAPIVKHENYFVGDNAVAYGKYDATSDKVVYNLKDLFKTDNANLAFTESKVWDEVDEEYFAYWFGTSRYFDYSASPAYVYVPKYSYESVYNAANVNPVAVNAAHEFTVTYKVFGNPYIPSPSYTFNLTVKSPIAEGSFSSNATKTIETSAPVYFNVNDFAGVDVFGDKFYVGNTYKYDAENEVYTSTVVNKLDTDRIASVVVSAYDDNAKDYLTIDGTKDANGNVTFGKLADVASADAFKVTRKAGLTQLVQDTPCKVRVRITDKWGVRTDAYVTVVLKAF